MNERWVIARVNRMVYLISIFLGLALGAGYFFDYVNSEVPFGFFFAFAGAVAVQQICNAVIYFGDRGSPRFKYAALIGYFAVYLVAMFGRLDALFGLNIDSIALCIYVIIIPVMIMYVGYFDIKLIKIAAVLAVIVNIAKVVFQISIGYTSSDDINEYLVQMGCIVITVVSVYVLAKITHDNHLKKLNEAEDATHQAELARTQAEVAAGEIQNSINYASNIQRKILPSDDDMTAAFTDWSVIWKPRDIVGGDIYWLKRFDRGTVLCVVDCTGHGTPGALLTMLVTSALGAIVRSDNCDDTADIVSKLDRRLSDVIHAGFGVAGRCCISDIDDGCDIAVLFFANDGYVHFSSGNMPIFVCDGEDVTHYRGQRIFVGEGKLKKKCEVAVHNIPTKHGEKIYIASDGLYDQKGGGDGRLFGYTKLKEIIYEKHDENLSAITSEVWDAFEQYRGDEPLRDDFILVAVESCLPNGESREF